MQLDLTPEQLAAIADVVAIVEPTSFEPRYSTSGAIETEIWLHRVEVLRGTLPDTASIVVPGGRIDRITEVVEDVPSIPLDQRVLIYLIRTDTGYQLIGGDRSVQRLEGTIPSHFATNGYDWSWHDAPVEEPFELNVTTFDDVGDADDVEQAYEDGINVWNIEGLADLWYEYGGRTTATRQGSGDDDHNVTIYGGSTGGSTLAVSTSTFIDDEEIDCDTQVYGRNSGGTVTWSLDPDGANQGDMDLRQTLTHELGHCLGLGHSNVEGAIMYPYSTPNTGDEARHLTSDDRAGVQRLYGEVAPDLSTESVNVEDTDGDLDGVAEPGERLLIAVTLENIGDGTAWGLDVTLDGEPSLGEPPELHIDVLPAPTPVGERIGVSSAVLQFPLTVDSACDQDFEADMTMTVTDALGTEWTFPVSFPISCEGAFDDTDSEDTDGRQHNTPGGGCGCGIGSAGGSFAISALVALVAMSRRKR